MTSAVQICNRGLSWVGLGRITSLSEGSALAEQCNLHYTDELDQLLVAYPWAFARRRQVLAELANDRTAEWAYRYQKPNDTLHVHWVNDTRIVRANGALGRIASAEYEASGSAIYSDIEGATMEFTARVNDASMFPPLFRTALSWAIARAVVVALTEDSRRIEFAQNGAEAAREAAIAADARDETHSYRYAPDWLVSRGAIDPDPGAWPWWRRAE